VKIRASVVSYFMPMDGGADEGMDFMGMYTT